MTLPTWMDADLAAYRDSLKRFVHNEVLPHQAAWRAQGHVDRSVWHRAGEFGLLLADIPADHGGADGHFGHMAVLWEELGAIGDAAFGTQVHAVVAQYLLHHGTAAQRARYLPRMAQGDLVAAIAITEPAAGSDMQGIRTAAVQQADGSFLLRGSKRFISNGHLADLILVAARTPGVEGARGLSLLLLDAQETQGLRRGPIADMIGRKGQDVCDLFFDDLHLPADAVLGGTGGRGFSQLMKELPYERLAIAVSALAAIERALALGLEHSRLRKVFGKPLFELQQTRFTLAKTKAQATAARCLVDNCIAQLIAGKLTPETAATAKWYLTELLGRVADDCLQLFGGDGYMAEHPIGQLYTDARVQRIYGGASELMLEVIAHAL